MHVELSFFLVLLGTISNLLEHIYAKEITSFERINRGNYLRLFHH